MTAARPRLSRTPTPAPGARVLVLYVHPAPHRSRANRRLAAAARAVPGVTVHDLYDAAPDFDIDVPAEQGLLTAHRHLVVQHPLYWYSGPALLKQWLDLVLALGWAYGPGGDALQGITWTSAVTTGGPVAAYQHPEPPRHDLEVLLSPFRQTAWLCGMPFHPPFAVHGVHRADDATLDREAARYADLLRALVGSTP